MPQAQAKRNAEQMAAPYELNVVFVLNAYRNAIVPKSTKLNAQLMCSALKEICMVSAGYRMNSIAAIVPHTHDPVN